jgi:DNA-binding transcriptional MerR regulator
MREATGMVRSERAGFRIGQLAERASTSTDTIRYYERLGLLGVPGRTGGGYRVYTDADLGRLLFIRRAKLLGLTLDEIRGLLGVAQSGACPSLRQEVAGLLLQKIAECDIKLTELAAFKASLLNRYHLTLERQDEAACDCAAFPSSCACLPVGVEELLMPAPGPAMCTESADDMPPDTARQKDGDAERMSSGSEALEALFWRDEILQALFWLQGEGLAETADARELAGFLARDEEQVAQALVCLAHEGDLECADGKYRLSERGRQEGGRRFQEEFAELTRPGHGECAPGCSCHDPAHAGEPCPSHRSPT